MGMISFSTIPLWHFHSYNKFVHMKMNRMKTQLCHSLYIIYTFFFSVPTSFYPSIQCGRVESNDEDIRLCSAVLAPRYKTIHADLICFSLCSSGKQIFNGATRGAERVAATQFIGNRQPHPESTCVEPDCQCKPHK